MKLNFTFIFLTFILLSSCQNNKKLTIEGVTEENIKVMTYNIRLDTNSDGENAWSHRKDLLSSQVLFLSPDILGVQEALPNQIQDLNQLLKNYKSIGQGRDGGNNGEYSAIYYNSSKLKVEEYHTFWLSKTPDTISKGWDAALPRICTYGLFTTPNKTKFWFFNTHFDHVGETARKESMKLILKKIASKNQNNYPVVLVGDFNVEPDSDVIEASKKTLNDSKNIARVKFGSNGTFNGFKYNQPVTRRIDYILVSKFPNIKVEKYAVLTSSINFKFPSDHFPVYCELKLK